MSDFLDLIGSLGAAVADHRPWPRVETTRKGWLSLADRLASAPWVLLAEWAEAGAVHVALLSEEDGEAAVVTLPCPQGRFPSLARVRPGAKRLERAIQDLTGLTAEGLDDPRPWLDHDQWRQRLPLSASPAMPLGGAQPYEFLPVEGEGLHRIPVGPVHAGIIEPGHFRFTVQGETVVRLEERLGYTHKGTERLMRGRLAEEAARLAGRLSGDSTVAATWAFCQAVENALGLELPPRALLLRALMAELERLANHVGDIGAICNDAAFGLMQAECSTLRERIARAADACFGHRLMMDRIVPGGVAVDLKEEGKRLLSDQLPAIGREVSAQAAVYDATATLQDRMVGTGVLRPELARRFGAGGFVGRASGRAFDARRDLAYSPYEFLDLDVAVLEAGDVDARVRVRIREVMQGVRLAEQVLKRLDPGPARALLPPVERTLEGVAVVEGFRGDYFAWVRLGEGGRVDRCHLRDPSWFQWPLLEAVIEGNIVADFPLCNKSFNCSYSGHDL